MPIIAALGVFPSKVHIISYCCHIWLHGFTKKNHEFIASLHESAWKNAHRVDIVTMTIYTQQLVGDG